MILKKRWFVKNIGDDAKVEEFYDIKKDDILGTGTYGSVTNAIDVRTK